jgi:hypothetical protein
MRRFRVFYTVLLALLPRVFAHPAFSYAIRNDITLVPDNTTLVSDTAAAATEKRGASPFVVNRKQPWPELWYNNRRIHLITYCYTNKATRDRLECNIVSFAIARWRVKLNSRAFAGTTNVRFLEAQDPASRTAHYCFDDQGTWNDNVPDDALWIDLQGVGLSAKTTAGWSPPTHDPFDYGRHRMFLSWHNNAAQMTDVVTHEVR